MRFSLVVMVGSWPAQILRYDRLGEAAFKVLDYANIRFRYRHLHDGYIGRVQRNLLLQSGHPRSSIDHRESPSHRQGT